MILPKKIFKKMILQKKILLKNVRRMRIGKRMMCEDLRNIEEQGKSFWLVINRRGHAVATGKLGWIEA